VHLRERRYDSRYGGEFFQDWYTDPPPEGRLFNVTKDDWSSEVSNGQRVRVRCIYAWEPAFEVKYKVAAEIWRER